MFAGEGTPERTNRRFHLPRRRAGGRAALDGLRLASRSTARIPPSAPTSAARSATPASRSCTLDDAKKLYSGFDLCAPTTSVSMTINGPAPIILAFFLNAAIDQQVERHLRETGELGAPCARASGRAARSTAASCRRGDDGLGIGLLGVPGDERRRRRDLRAHPRRGARAACAARCRPTSSRRTRPRTPASSRPSSRCG